ncbi:MAG: hypothetical protein AB7F50_10215 [Fimbriimonadaceae bacterium]
MRAAWLAFPLLVAVCAPPHRKGQASLVHDEVVRALKEGSYAEGATVAWPDQASSVLRAHEDYVSSLAGDARADLVARGYALSYLLLATGDPKKPSRNDDYDRAREMEQLLGVYPLLTSLNDAYQLKMLLVDWIPRVCLRWQSASGLAGYIGTFMDGGEFGGGQAQALAWMLGQDPKLFASALTDVIGYDVGREDVLESRTSLWSLRYECAPVGAYRRDLERAMEVADSVKFDSPRHKRAWVRFLRWLSAPLDE